MLKKIDDTFLFIFDPSEVVKPFAEKMEALQFVRDASEKPRLVFDPRKGKLVEKPVLKPGYPLRVAIAISPNGDVLPIELSLYSTASESFLSSNDENLQPLETLLHKTYFQPTLILDREFDAFAIIRHLCGLNQKFVIRLKKTRKFLLPGVTSRESYSREEISQNFAFLNTQSVITYSKNGYSESKLFSFRAAHVRLLSELKNQEIFRKIDDDTALTLVELRIEKESGTPTLYLLTNKSPKNEADLEAIGRAYLARWNVEEYIRFLKQHFELESFLVRDLGRMKNLMHAVYIATVILHLLTDQESLRGIRNHHHLVKNALEVAPEKVTRDFFLYAYGRGLTHIVQANQTLLKGLNAGSKNSTYKNPNQTRFRIPD
ncbi:MAG TPA: transposase [Candidatus Paceibacterota bacterium]